MRRLALAATFLSLSASAQDSVVEARLDNGLRIAVQQDARWSFAGVCVGYNVGAADDPEGYRGLAHLVEHLMFTGSPRAADGIHAALEPAGAIDIGGSTTFDATMYCEEVPVGALDLTLFVEADRMGYLLDVLSARELDVQREVVLREFAQRGGSAPGHRIFVAEAEALYPRNHPYRRVFERPDDLRAARLDHVRFFHQHWYTPANATLAVVSPLPPAEVLTRIERFFAHLEGGNARANNTLPVALPRATRIVVDRPVRTEELVLTWITPAWLQPGDAELDLIGAHLQKVIDEEISTQRLRRFSVAQRSRRHSSEFSIHLHAQRSVDALSLLPAVEAALQDLREHLLTNDALDDLRAHYVTRYLLTNDRPRSRARHLALSGAMQRLHTVERNMDRFASITPQRLRQVARQYLAPEHRVLSHGQFVREAPLDGVVR
ncbi:MAG: pitrilysin family protein [Myxococcota bacterium]